MAKKAKAGSNKGADPLMQLVRAIVANDEMAIDLILKIQPGLTLAAAKVAATRADSKTFFFESICHYIYAGDTALHMAAAAHRPRIARTLIEKSARLDAVNRRGAQPLHYACDGGPGMPAWNPQAQAATVSLLIEMGANPNALDKSGVGPLHRAVRTRCAEAVKALLGGGADPRLKNKSGSTPLHLAVQTTGRGGGGEPRARELQREIVATLLKGGASLADTDAAGKTTAQRCRDTTLLDYP
jgi:hypothetical protein